MKHAIATAALVLANLAQAQTPAQMDYDRQQRDYWRAQEQQRQEQQRPQQIQQENAARQQQESADAARRSQESSRQFNDQFGRDMDAAHSRQQQALQNSRAQGAQWEAARQSWLKKPALAPASNPLLGRWTRPASSRGNGSDPFAALAALAKGGLCEALFGDGVFEFRAGTLVGIDRGAREQELDQVEYRGDARQVAVIPKTTLKLMVFEFDGPDRIHWQGQNCAMVRVKAAPAAAAPATPVAAAKPGEDAVLSLVAGLDGGPLAGTKFIVLRHSVDVALASGGFRPPPGMTPFKAWSLECQRRTAACQQGVQGIRADGLGVLQTDAQGKAQTPRLAAGSYYVFGSARQGDRQWMWNQRVELKQGMNTVRLDPSNASPVN
jgi:hypothetical protein